MENYGLTFYLHNEEMLLSSVHTTSPEFIFSRGLKVGDTKDKVINEFFKENELLDVISAEANEAFGKYLYGTYTSDSFETVKETEKVEYAFINNYGYNPNDLNSTYMIEYHYYEPPYQNEYAKFEDKSGSLIFDVNSEDVVIGIRWYFNPVQK